MPKFNYKAKDINNKIIRGTFFARDEDDLRDIITNQNCFLISSKKIPESSQTFSFLETIKVSDLTLFCRQFAIMLKSGISIVNCVEVLRENSKVKKLKDILEVVYNELLKGGTLSESFGKYPKTFPMFFRNMVQIGELSGHLDEVFNRLADYYEKDDKTKRKVKSALSYPIFLIVLCLGVVALLALYIMPMFKDMFESLDSELPPITVIVLSVSEFIQNNYGQLFLGIIAFVVMFIFLKRVKSVKRVLDNIKLHNPLTGVVHQALITSRFTRGFLILMSSGIPIIEVVGTMRKLMDNLVVEEKLKIATDEIKRGQRIAKSIETIGVFPPMLVEMIAIGEQTGQLEEVLSRIADYYDDQVDFAVKKMTSVLEPLMIIIVASLICFVLLAVFLPMMGMMEAIENYGTV